MLAFIHRLDVLYLGLKIRLILWVLNLIDRRK